MYRRSIAALMHSRESELANQFLNASLPTNILQLGVYVEIHNPTVTLIEGALQPGNGFLFPVELCGDCRDLVGAGVVRSSLGQEKV